MHNIKKTYRVGDIDIQAVNGVSFSIEQGEFVIICGTSGAGKSTVLNILGGIDTVTSGDFIVDGNRVDLYKNKELTLYRRNDVGFVFQFYNLVANLNALENVEFATQISKKPSTPIEILEQVGLLDRAYNFPAQLSGGEQQRVAIARALAKNPKLLLCDEPTGALDYNTGKNILKLLQDTCKKTGMTVIVVTHNLALCSIADKVIRMKNGTIENIKINTNPASVADIEW